MKRFCPSVLKVAKDCEKENPQMIALRVRKRGKISSQMMVFKRMVNFDGQDLDPRDVLDVTEQKKETQKFQDLSDAMNKKYDKSKVNIVDDADDVNPQKFIYYEFYEQTDHIGAEYKAQVVVVNEEDFLNQSSDSYDSEDSNDENNPNNSYPTTPSSEYSEDEDDEFYGDYSISVEYDERDNEEFYDSSETKYDMEED
ncbi:hypothetical protein ENUP19_0263G0025 [Entamoeba nuttalli]|uniref:RNA polymerase II nuclear localization protein SLC7A6OS n=1 Tax=Entamoeba nuttalli TaxID=412467 RepID=A0ABQ0DSI9_9EUKA